MRNVHERGSVLLVAMVALTAMLGVGALAILSVQSGVKTAGNNRFQTIALYSAESGAWAGLDFLRDNCDTTNLFSAFVPDAAGVPQMPSGIYGNNVQPGQENNPFDLRLKAWYQVTILNNLGDAGQTRNPPADTDSQVVLHVVGYGPDGTQATIEMEVRNDACLTAFCDAGYAQQGVGFAEDSPCAVEVAAGDGDTRALDP